MASRAESQVINLAGLVQGVHLGAFRTGADLIALGSGESWQGTWGLGRDQS
jgi:hypothetical protein